MKQKKHSWKICPIGSYFVKSHYKTINGKKHYWKAHCRKGSGKKEILTTDEIHEISTRFKHERLKMPKAYDFETRGKLGNKYDLLIAGWVKYWRDILGKKTNIDVDFVKILIKSESTFGKGATAKIKNSKKQAMIIKMPRLSRYPYFLLLSTLMLSCAHINGNVEYVYPPENPFPSILSIRKYKDQNIGLVAKLKPETIKMSCRLRNDSPYYWCDFEGELAFPDPKLPKLITSTFHVVVAKEGKKAALNFAERIKKYSEPVVIVLEKSATKSKVDKTIYSQLLGAYNSKECFDVFDDYSLCPNSAKKLDIFSGQFIE